MISSHQASNRRAWLKVCWMVSVDRRRNKDVCRTHYALTAVLVILPTRWADVALQPLVFFSVRQV
jgi:hypothetical protein